MNGKCRAVGEIGLLLRRQAVRHAAAPHLLMRRAAVDLAYGQVGSQRVAARPGVAQVLCRTTHGSSSR